MELEPLQKPHPPLWYGVHSPESAERAARRALNIVSLDPAAPTRSFTDRFRRSGGRFTGAVTRPCPRSALAASWWWPTMTKRRCASPGAPTPSGTGASTTCSGSGEARRRINVPRTSTASSPPARGSPAVRTRSGRSCGHSSIRPAPTISSGSSPSATSPSTRPFVPWISFRTGGARPGLVWCLTNTLTNLRVLLAVGCVRHSGLDPGSSSRGARHQGGDRRSPLHVGGTICRRGDRWSPSGTGHRRAGPHVRTRSPSIRRVSLRPPTRDA